MVQWFSWQEAELSASFYEEQPIVSSTLAHARADHT